MPLTAPPLACCLGSGSCTGGMGHFSAHCPPPRLLWQELPTVSSSPQLSHSVLIALGVSLSKAWIVLLASGGGIGGNPSKQELRSERRGRRKGLFCRLHWSVRVKGCKRRCCWSVSRWGETQRAFGFMWLNWGLCSCFYTCQEKQTAVAQGSAHHRTCSNLVGTDLRESRP